MKDVIRNQIQTNRYANGMARDAARMIDDAFRDMLAVLVRRDPTGLTGINRKRRLAALYREADEILNGMYGRINQSTTGGLVDLAEVQETWAARQLEREVGAVVAEVGGRRLGRQFWRSVIAEDPTEGAVVREWWGKQRANTRFAFRREVQKGLVNHEPIGDISRRVRGVMGTTTRDATALVRTAVNQIATKAHQETYKQHDDVTDSYQYVATLDSRTTEICMALDGKIFRYGEGPEPPQHWNCRSTTVPIVKWRELGLAPPPAGMRASPERFGGPVSAKTNYGAWLRAQDAATQNEALGVGKAKLFRAGKFSLDELIRRDGSVITLEELKRKVT